MKRLLTLALLGVASASFAGTYFFDGVLTTGSPTFVNPGGASGTGFVHYYNVLQFTVDLSGTYTFEAASPNTNPANPSNALDTYLRLYSGSFNPASPGAGIASNDDFTGTLTVLPGPYAGTVSATATGFTGAQPSSRMLNVALTAGTQYFLINTSFRQVGYVSTTNEGQATGHYYDGISGQGNINVVPEPASMAVLGIGALALLRRRKKA
jgi:hypothetical protein